MVRPNETDTVYVDEAYQKGTIRYLPYPNSVYYLREETQRQLSPSKNVSGIPIVDVDVWLFMVWKWIENELFAVRISIILP